MLYGRFPFPLPEAHLEALIVDSVRWVWIDLVIQQGIVVRAI